MEPEQNTLLTTDPSNRLSVRYNDTRKNMYEARDDTKRPSYDNTEVHNNPELEKIKVTHQIELENKELDYKHEDSRDVVESCCFKLRQSSLNFFGKLAISVGTVSLCSYQLIHLTDCSHQTLYSGILGIILGHWMRV